MNRAALWGFGAHRPAVCAFLAFSFLVAGSSACKPTPPRPEQATPTISATGPGDAPPPSNVAPLSSNARTEDERNTISVFREASDSTVFVTQTKVVVDDFEGTEQEVPVGSGSGFVWDTLGHVVTNYHVVKGARTLTVTFGNQKTFHAEVVGVEPRKDIAVLKVPAPKELLKPVVVPKKLDLEVGQKTLAIGNPFGLDHTLTTGIVSALGRQVQGIGGVTIRDMIQTDAPINPGNSGGPLLDSAGQLIGMNTMIFSRSGSSAGIGFAVPVSTVARVVPQILKTGRADQLGLGIKADPMGRLERQLGVRGVVVIKVPADSPAAKAGLQGLQETQMGIRLGDVIVQIGDTKISSYDDYYNALDLKKAGETVEVKVRRGDATVSLKLEVLVVN